MHTSSTQNASLVSSNLLSLLSLLFLSPLGVTMVSSTVYGHKISSVVPRTVTGDIVRELTNMELAMKLHYLKGVYYFKQSEIIDALTISVLKIPMFPWLDMYFSASGRIRRSETGRPFIKCNDCGVRIVEAKCSRTLDEWLAVKDFPSWKHLVPEKVLGPELYFSPMIYIQFTNFKCGGMAIGFSWAHVLGDAVSATKCFNQWGQLLSGKLSPISYNLPNPQNEEQKPVEKSSASVMPHSTKLVEPVGDCWLAPNNCEMATYSFEITELKLKQLQAKESTEAGYFEMISALIWQCLAKVREGKELKSVTICKNDPSIGSCSLKNEQKICYVKTDSSPGKVGLSELAMLIANEKVDETKLVQGMVDRETGKPDVIIYGANLTFVDMQEIELYGLELKGQKPIHVEYSIDGVGDEGAVLVLQGGKNKGRLVKLILPENQIPKLREMLESTWGIA